MLDGACQAGVAVLRIPSFPHTFSDHGLLDLSMRCRRGVSLLTATCGSLVGPKLIQIDNAFKLGVFKEA